MHSERVHLVHNSVNRPEDLLLLFDRFLDGKLQYPLEWDDFISWSNENISIERIRRRICEWEPLLFSQSAADREEYAERVLRERNELASICGKPSRL